MRLIGKTAIVTGAANGMGAAEATLFAKEGAQVVACDVDAEALGTVVRTIRDNGGEAIAVNLDVSDKDAWEAAVKVAIAEFGKIDILVNNAGIHPVNRLVDIPYDEWMRVIGVNMNGAFLGSQAVIPHMRAAGGGSIVNISSIAAYKGGGPGHYGAAKGALLSLTRTIAIEHAKDRIRANAVLPGLIVTNLTAEVLADPVRRAWLVNEVPLPYFGEPEDVAAGVLFLASDEARFVTGSELVIDGGTLAK